jgi:hypothetical protein
VRPAQQAGYLGRAQAAGRLGQRMAVTPVHVSAAGAVGLAAINAHSPWPPSTCQIREAAADLDHPPRLLEHRTL